MLRNCLAVIESRSRRKKINHLCRAQLQGSRISTKFKSLRTLETHFHQFRELQQMRKKRAQPIGTRYNMSSKGSSIKPPADLLLSKAIRNQIIIQDMRKSKIVGRTKPLLVPRIKPTSRRKLSSFQNLTTLTM